MTRKLVIALGLIFVLSGGWYWWQATHPILTDDEQLAANLEDIRQSLENGNVKNAVGYMAQDAKFNGFSPGRIQDQFTMGYRFGGHTDFRLNFLNTHTELKGASAATQGYYKLDTRTRSGSEPHSGQFSLEWEKRDGQWVITEGHAEGEMPN